MKNFIIFLLLMAVGLFGCEKVNEKTLSDYEKEAEALNALLKKYEEPAQVFEVPTDKPTKIVGKFGTTIYVNPDDLIGKNGQKLGKTIKVELKELHTQEQFLRNNIQTVSDGKLLVSGGAYFIGMSSENQTLTLKEGRSLKISFPKISDEKMGLFYGERDSLGRMNWVDQKKELEEEIYEEFIVARSINDPDYYTKGSEKIIISKDTAFINQEIRKMIARGIPFSRKRRTASELIKENQIQEKFYQTMEILQLGWINCDRFQEISNKTNIKIAFTDRNPIATKIFILLKDFNSVMDWSYFWHISNSNDDYYQVPIGYEVRLIAFTVKGDKIFTYSSDFTIKKDHSITIDLKESNEKELEKLFKIN